MAERHAARQDQSTSIRAWLDLQCLLKNKGRFYLVFPARRLAELCTALQRVTLEPKLLRFVHPHQEKPASLVLIEAVKQAGSDLQIAPPLVMHDSDGGYSEEMREIYG